MGKPIGIYSGKSSEGKEFGYYGEYWGDYYHHQANDENIKKLKEIKSCEGTYREHGFELEIKEERKVEKSQSGTVGRFLTKRTVTNSLIHTLYNPTASLSVNGKTIEKYHHTKAYDLLSKMEDMQILDDIANKILNDKSFIWTMNINAEGIEYGGGKKSL